MPKNKANILVPAPFDASPDLTNGYYPDYPPIPGWDPLLNDILLWLTQHGAPLPQWSQPANQGGSGDPPAEMRWYRVPNFADPNNEVMAGAYDAVKSPSVLATQLNNLFVQPLDIPPYPGYDIRTRREKSPIGRPDRQITELRNGNLYYAHKPSGKRIWRTGDEWAEIRDLADNPAPVGLVRRFRLEWVLLSPGGLGGVQATARYAWLDISKPGERA